MQRHTSYTKMLCTGVRSSLVRQNDADLLLLSEPMEKPSYTPSQCSSPYVYTSRHSGWSPVQNNTAPIPVGTPGIRIKASRPTCRSVVPAADSSHLNFVKLPTPVNSRLHT